MKTKEEKFNFKKELVKAKRKRFNFKKKLIKAINKWQPKKIKYETNKIGECMLNSFN